MHTIPKIDVLGTPISLTSYDEMLSVLDRPPEDRALKVAVCTVHSVMTARQDPRLAAALRDADVATPDGMPLVWALRASGHREQQRVYGPDLMAAAFPYGISRGWSHYLYGATEDTLARLVGALGERAPGARIVGTHAPPFRPLTREEEDAVIEDIRSSGADIVWVGLGMPKQELWMAQVAHRLPGVAVVGVGAAFDLLSGTVRQAPSWMQRIGLEWLFRLSQEPRRLWRRYLWNNPAYLGLLGAQLVRDRWRARRYPT